MISDRMVSASLNFVTLIIYSESTDGNMGDFSLTAPGSYVKHKSEELFENLSRDFDRCYS